MVFFVGLKMKIEFNGEEYLVDRKAEKYLRTNYPLFFDPDKDRTNQLVTQLRTDPQFDLKDKNLQVYVGLKKEHHEFGSIMPGLEKKLSFREI